MRAAVAVGKRKALPRHMRVWEAVETMTPEQQLMTKIKSQCGSWIDEAIAGTPYPAALLAALTANESGGDPQESRFEPKVFADLALVAIGRKANYGAIGRTNLIDWCSPSDPDRPPRSFSDALLALVNLATSWGPTQIMGYQALAGGYALSELPNLQTHFKHTVAMLEDFRTRFQIVASQAPGGPSPWPNSWADFFRCWNTGRPDGQTADPQYVARGLDRMTIYGSL
jgi:hypothetical protein